VFLAFACFHLISSLFTFKILCFFLVLISYDLNAFFFFMGVLVLACFQLSHSFFTFKICFFSFTSYDLNAVFDGCLSFLLVFNKLV
jgi:hypothetical protein